MMYPLIRKTPLYKVSIPEFCAGVNYKDSVSLVEDNQLTDVKNMWYEDALLRTRPAVVANEQGCFSNTAHYINDTEKKILVKSTNVYRFYNGQKQRLIITLVKDEAGYRNRAKFAFIGEDGSIDELTDLPTSCKEINPIYSGMCPDLNDVFAFMCKDILYILTDYCEDESASLNPLGFKYDYDNKKWIMLRGDDFYSPTVILNGKPQKVNTHENNYSLNGDFLEGYNTLGNSYKVKYDSYSSENGSRFVFPTKIENFEKIVVTHTDINGNVYTHNVSNLNYALFIGDDFSDLVYIGSEIQGDNARIAVANTNQGELMAFYFIDTNNKPINGFANDNGMQNNITATVYYKKTDNQVVKCSISDWYGGNANGINGGTRLFVSGNKNYPNKIMWSDLNNPLYFPENNYAFVGDDNSAVTAFGKQGELLIIFKENEVFYTHYVAGDSITASDVVNQKIIDITSSTTIFPIIQINSEIGCDCPNTVALCQNRLVWANTYGKVYTLVGTNQNSERNIIDISAYISKKIKKLSTSALKNAVAVDFNEHYYLCADNNVFVLDYGNNAFSYISNYYGSESSLKQLAWYYWELPVFVDTMFVCEQNIFVVTSSTHFNGEKAFSNAVLYNFDKNQYIDTLANFDINGNCTVETSAISSYMQTKMFDFGRPDKKKSINQVYLTLGKCTDSVSVIFDTYNNCIFSKLLKRIKHGDTETFRLLPQLPHISHFGVKLECKGVFSLVGISINYKPLGSVM